MAIGVVAPVAVAVVGVVIAAAYGSADDAADGSHHIRDMVADHRVLVTCLVDDKRGRCARGQEGSIHAARVGHHHCSRDTILLGRYSRAHHSRISLKFM